MVEDINEPKMAACPGWCGTVGWVSSGKPKGHQFNQQSQHMLGLQVQSLVGAHMEDNQSMFFPLSKN